MLNASCSVCFHAACRSSFHSRETFFQGSCYPGMEEGWTFPLFSSSVFRAEPTCPLVCGETEKACRPRAASPGAGLASLWHERPVEKSQTCADSWLCGAHSLCDPPFDHGSERVLLPRTGLCSAGLWRIHTFLPGGCTLGVRPSREQPSETWLDKPGQQRAAIVARMDNHADEWQSDPCCHYGHHGAWDIASLWSVSTTHLSQLVQSPAFCPNHSGIFFSYRNSHCECTIPRKEVVGLDNMQTFDWDSLVLCLFC